MPATIVVVHEDPIFRAELHQALLAAGHEATTFSDPTLALTALRMARTIEVLVTGVQFGDQPIGLSLARVARSARPGVRVIFTSRPRFQSFAEGFGEFMAMPADVHDVVSAVGRMDIDRAAD